MSLREVLKAAASRRLAEGWVYLPDEDITISSDCILITDEADYDEFEIEAVGKRLGFPREGLDTQTIEDVCDWTKRLRASPDDDLYLQAFIYYWKFDAFLPAVDAPDPPPREVVLEMLDREFYLSLGEERAASPCRREGCGRGAVNMSVLCGKHHFEMVHKRPYLFE